MFHDFQVVISFVVNTMDYLGGAFGEFTSARSNIAGQIFSVVATLVIAGLGYVIGIIKNNLKYRRDIKCFLMVFGRGVSSPEGVIMSLGKWKTIPNVNRSCRFTKVTRNGYEEHYGPDDMVNVYDMRAAFFIDNVFAKNFRRSPIKHAFDDEEIDFREKTAILIGSQLANKHVNQLMEELERSKVIDRLPFSFERIEENSDSKAKLIIVNHIENCVYESSDDYEYGMIMRLQNIYCGNCAHYIFVVAGMHQESTEEAGFIFPTVWERFAGDGKFKAIVFKMERENGQGRKKSGRIVDSYDVPRAPHEREGIGRSLSAAVTRPMD